MYSADVAAGICRLFLRLPESEPKDEEGVRCVRDAHYYAGGYMYNWLEYQRIHLGQSFRALPWYRQKAICKRTVQRVHDRTLVYLQGKSTYTAEDVLQIWKTFREALPPEADQEYQEFLEMLHARGDFAP